MALDGRILVLGGLAGGSSTGSVLSIDPGAGAVVHAGTLATPVHDAAGAVVGGAAHVFGGGRVGSTDVVQTYSAGGSHVTGHLPRPRSDLAADMVDGRAYVVGGFDGARVSPYVLASDDGNTFRIAGTLATGVRYPAIAVLERSIYVVGGSTATTESTATGQVDLVQRFDVDTGKTTIVAHLPHALAHASAFVIGGGVFVAGGVIGRTAQVAIMRIDPATAAVTDAGTLPGPRSDAAAVTLGDTTWLIGGENGGPTAPLDTVVSVRPEG